jgi:hypothetical protein
MKILKETPLEQVKLDIDMTDAEHKMLLDYGRHKMTVEQLDDLIIEWAFVDIIKNTIDSIEEQRNGTRSKNVRKTRTDRPVQRKVRSRRT